MGAFWYCSYQGGLNAEQFVALLQKMMRHRRAAGGHTGMPTEAGRPQQFSVRSPRK
jgi:hypothetical protein